MPQYFGTKYYPGKHSPVNSPLRPPTPVVNPRGDLRGRNTPRSNNLSQRIPSPTRYSNILDGRTGQLMPYGPGTSLPGYNPANRTRGELNAVARGAARRLGLAVRSFNPALRLAVTAYDLYAGLDGEPFYKFGPDTPPGFVLAPGYSCTRTYPEGGQPCPDTSVKRWSFAIAECPIPLSIMGEFIYPSVARPTDRTFVFGRLTQSGTCVQFRGTFAVAYPESVQPEFYPYYREAQRAPVGVIPASIPMAPAASESVPGRDPSPYQRPVPRYAIPSIDIEIAPGSTSHVPPRNGIHVRRPPRPNEREKKRGIPYPKVLGAIAALYDAATEAQEIVDIFYDRLGKKCRGAKSSSEKAYCVYANLHTLDIDGAIGDLILNHYEDKAWGKFHSYAKKAPFGVSLTGGKPYYSIDIP